MLKMSTSASDITDRSMESKIGTSSVVVDLETLPASNPVTTLTAQDLQDSLVEQSLSETILLQNVTFDANLFDGLNLELDGCGVGSGASSAGTSVIHHNNSHQLGTTIDLSSISSDTMTQNSFEQMNLLETLELQIIKEVQQQQQQQQQSASSNAFLTSSSDPLVSSTTTIYTYEKDQDQQLAADSTDFKAATTSFSGVFTKSPMTVAVKTEPTNSQIIKIGSSGSGHQLIPVSEGALHQQQQQSVILHRSDSSTCTTSSIAELRNLTTTSNGSICGDKAIYLTGPISTAALSLANMKVVGQNVVAFISDQQQERPVLSAEKQSAQPQQSSTSVGAAGTSQQQQQTRLIIIEEKKQPTALTLTTTNASTSTSTITRPSSKNAAATATSAAAKESKGKADNQKNSSTASAATAKTNSNSNSASSVKEAKGASNIASSTGSNSEANQFTDADSNSGNPSSKAFVPCKVCGDKASGYHYGVTSCEGCKGFFRRSIQKQIEYRCLRDGKCLIIRLNRNRCQYCRFKKCLAVGMSRDSVRYGRVPKKSKEKERLEEKANGVTQAEADQSSVVDIDAKDLALYDTILTISQAHHANCSYTDDKIKGLAKKPIFIMTSHVKLESSDECSSSPDVGSVSESMETQKIELWEQLALLITPCIQRVVEFAKRIPGFSDLTQDDQLILIKLGFFEVWLVHISKTADFVENTLTFADGSFLNRKQLELMFDHEFVGNLFHLMSGLNNLALNDTEIGLFAAIILLQSDRPQIYDIKAINKIQENVMEALKTQITRNHSNDTATFQKLMQKINELRALGSSHSLHLQWFRSNWLRLHLPPLFAEIWDIPLPKSTTFASATPVANISAVSQSSISPRDQQQQQQTNSSPQLNNASMASPIEN